jgi:hypothetical protein
MIENNIPREKLLGLHTAKLGAVEVVHAGQLADARRQVGADAGRERRVVALALAQVGALEVDEPVGLAIEAVAVLGPRVVVDARDGGADAVPGCLEGGAAVAVFLEAVGRPARASVSGVPCEVGWIGLGGGCGLRDEGVDLRLGAEVPAGWNHVAVERLLNGKGEVEGILAGRRAGKGLAIDDRVIREQWVFVHGVSRHVVHANHPLLAIPWVSKEDKFSRGNALCLHSLAKKIRQGVLDAQSTDARGKVSTPHRM